jgi:Uma2 family endonuclease
VKLEAYARAGLPEYAVIDPAERQLRLYRLADGAYGPPLVFDESAALAFACLPDIRFTVGGLFAGSPDTTL